MVLLIYHYIAIALIIIVIIFIIVIIVIIIITIIFFFFIFLNKIFFNFVTYVSSDYQYPWWQGQQYGISIVHIADFISCKC